jgi:hypothetical protein
MIYNIYIVLSRRNRQFFSGGGLYFFPGVVQDEPGFHFVIFTGAPPGYALKPSRTRQAARGGVFRGWESYFLFFEDYPEYISIALTDNLPYI